jgi:hypothetical protein
MAVNLPNPGVFESQLGQQFVQFRIAYQAIVNQNGYVASLGGAAALEAAPFSMSTQDAQAIVAALGNITNLAGIVAAIDGTEPFWGGQ